MSIVVLENVKIKSEDINAFVQKAISTLMTIQVQHASGISSDQSESSIKSQSELGKVIAKALTVWKENAKVSRRDLNVIVTTDTKIKV